MNDATKNYNGQFTGTVANGVSSTSFSGQIQDQWTGDVITPDDQTFWALGSCTKSFTATLLGQQVTNGAVAADSPVYPLIQQYLPSGTAPEALQSITLDQLATMMSGLPGDNFNGVLQGAQGPVNKMFAALMNAKNYDPNTLFDYSNIGYGLLSFAMVASSASPPPSADDLPAALLTMMTTNIFTPLSMPTATFYPPSQQSGYYLPYGNISAGKTSDGSKSSWPFCDGAGALYMTAPDLMTWLEANMAGTLPDGGTVFVQSDPVSTMQSTNKLWPEGQFITRGWFTNTFIGPKSKLPITMVTKNGAIPGFHCGVGFVQPAFPGETADYGVVIATNNNNPILPVLEQTLDNLING